MVSKYLKFFVCACLLLSASAHPVSGQSRVGTPPNNSDKTTQVPVQTYAVIDISGSATSSPVWNVALDDDNNAAFGFVTGGDTVYPQTYHTYTWQNGQLGSEQQLNCIINNYEHLDDPPNRSGEVVIHRRSFHLLPSGIVFGEEKYNVVLDKPDQNGHRAGADGTRMFSSQNGSAVSFDLPNPPFLDDIGDANHRGINPDCWLLGLSDNGNMTGLGWEWVPLDTNGNISSVEFSFVISGNTCHIFDRDGYNFPGNQGNIQLHTYGFEPGAINKQGWAIGYAPDTYTPSGLLWNGQEMTDIGSGYPIDLNEQAQVIVQGLNNDWTDAEGYLWENTSIVQLTSVLPKYLQGQIKNVYPTLISNQKSESDKSIKILATGQDNNNWKQMLFTRDNNGVWSFTEIQLPQGASITAYNFISINSSGVIAAIGNAGTGNGHALLLVPIVLTSASATNSPWTPPHPNVATDELDLPTDIISQSYYLGFSQATLDETAFLREALTIYYSDVCDSDGNRYPADVSVLFEVANGQFPNVSWSSQACLWTPDHAPEIESIGSGFGYIENINNGGFYRYNVHGVGNDTGLQVWLPVAGPDISTYWSGRINYFRNTWGPAYRAKLDRKLSWMLYGPMYLGMRYAIELQDIKKLGPNLDWSNTPALRGERTPCGLANIQLGGGFAGDKDRFTMFGTVIDFAKRNDMMYALIGSQMGLDQTTLRNGPNGVDMLNKLFGLDNDVGSPDTPATLEAYQAGFDLSTGMSLQQVMHDHGWKMQEPTSRSRKEWPSKETTAKGLNEEAQPLLEALIQ